MILSSLEYRFQSKGPILFFQGQLEYVAVAVVKLALARANLSLQIWTSRAS